MNKTKTVLAATGGALALVALVMAALAYLAFSDRAAALTGDEETEGLESVVSRVAGLMGKKPYPSLANKKRIEENRLLVEDWYSNLRQDASRGDWCADQSCKTPAQFKEQIARDAKSLAALPGPAKAPLLKAEFGFGPFKEYLADKMPPSDQLKKLQRQWFDITALIDVLATNGVTQVTDVQVVAPKAEEQEQSGSAKKNRKRVVKAARDESGKPSVETYRLAFQAQPAAFVAVLRQLSFQERFTVVDGFGFVREHDAIALALGEGEKKQDAAAGGGRRRGRRWSDAAAQPAEDAAEDKPNALVFNPETDALLNVEMTVSVYDFRSLEEDEKGSEK